jgi:hypothetical protein
MGHSRGLNHMAVASAPSLGTSAGPGPPAPRNKSVRGTRAHPWSAAAIFGGGAEATARWFRPVECPILPPGPLKAVLTIYVFSCLEFSFDERK